MAVFLAAKGDGHLRDVLPALAQLFAPPADPRYNVFDWEAWHKLARRFMK